MFLRRLHQADAGIGERRHEVLQPVGIDDVVGIEDADDLGIDGGAVHRDAQRAGLEALHLLGVDELEAFTERAAMVLDRLPEGGIGRVVDDDDAFVVRIVQPRQRIERLLEHLDRLEISGDVDRDLRVVILGHVLDRLALREQPLRRPAERDRRDLVDARHRDEDEGNKQDHAEREREGRAEDEIVPVPEREHGRGPGADAIGGRRQQERLPGGRLLQPQDRQRQQDADQQRDSHQLPIVGILHRAGPGEFRLAAGVEDAPVRTDAALEVFPGLIDGFDDVVFHADGFGAADEVAQGQRLLERTRVGVAQDCSPRSASRIRRSRCACPGTGCATDCSGRRPGRPPGPSGSFPNRAARGRR